MFSSNNEDAHQRRTPRTSGMLGAQEKTSSSSSLLQTSRHCGSISSHSLLTGRKRGGHLESTSRTHKKIQKKLRCQEAPDSRNYHTGHSTPQGLHYTILYRRCSYISLHFIQHRWYRYPKNFCYSLEICFLGNSKE